MDEQQRDLVLKAGLYLLILEGWSTVAMATRKFGPGSMLAVTWLIDHRYLITSRHGEVVRWQPEREFEHLWGELIPERPCPMRFRTATLAHKV